MRRLVLVSLLAAVFLFFGCIVNSNDVKAQDNVVIADMASAQSLLSFAEQGQLSSFKPTYQNQSDALGAACTKLNSLDSNKEYWSAQGKAICENKKGLDDCFFQLEKIKIQVKNGDANINLDSLDVLCKDLRSVGLQTNLDSFKTQYKAYGAWLATENSIISKWGNLTAFFSNSSFSEMKGAKASDLYNSYKDSSSKAQASLEEIKTECALKNGFNATNAKVEKICSSVDGYISDLGKANSIALDLFNFIGQFESGRVTIDSTFVNGCNNINSESSQLYELNLIKDTETPGYNKSDLSSMCQTFENLSNVYSGLGIPLVLENGDLSPTTKTELFKAKTVYVETSVVGGTIVGSGVIIMKDDSGYYILTNAHVALDYDSYTGSKYAPTNVRVKFYDGRAGYADKIAYDKEGYDFVILYVPSSGNYPSASYDPSYAPSDGDKVVAVGNPYGLQFSVSQGTVSGRRNLGCLTDYCYGYVIQTDTAINHGNSGGGLWDYNSGDLLGINSLGVPQTAGLNFAISMYQYDQIKDTFKWYSIG